MDSSAKAPSKGPKGAKSSKAKGKAPKPAKVKVKAFTPKPAPGEAAPKAARKPATACPHCGQVFKHGQRNSPQNMLKSHLRKAHPGAVAATPAAAEAAGVEPAAPAPAAAVPAGGAQEAPAAKRKKKVAAA